VAKVCAWYVVQQTADVTSPSSTIISPRDVRIDISTATLATYDPSGSEIDHFNLIVISADVSSHRLADNTERDFTCIGRSLAADYLGYRWSKENGVALYR